MLCLHCGGKDIEKKGEQQFYAWNCFVEMDIFNNEMTMQQVEKDGSLHSLNDLFSDQERRFYDAP